jgi:hypothetical protein
VEAVIGAVKRAEGPPTRPVPLLDLAGKMA